MNYEQYYIEAMNEITGSPLLKKHGMDQDELNRHLERKGIELPVSLREYYLVAGKHEINGEHNILHSPSGLEVMDDHLVFAEENQRVVIWGIKEDELASEDPVVYQGQEHDTIEWYSEERRFSAFIIEMWKWQRGVAPYDGPGDQ